MAISLFLASAWNASPASAGPAPLELSIPKTTGKYRVGTRLVPAVDRSRDMGFGKAGKRKLSIQLFYPRANRSRANGRKLRCPAAPYAPKPVIDRLVADTVPGRTAEIKSGVCRGGPVAKGKYPVIVFSHAFAAGGPLYTALSADLASRGFIVASISHTYEAFAVKFPKTPVTGGVYGGPLNASEAPPAELAELETVRASDASFTLTYVRALARKKGSQLWRHVRTRSAGILGHSLGGATAVEAANGDARFTASADLDGEVWNDGLPATNLDTPHLLGLSEGGLRDTFNLTLACSYFKRLTGDKHALLFAGTKHYAFSDFQALAPQVYRQYPDWPSGPAIPDFVGTADPAGSVSLQRKVLARFFRFYLVPGRTGSLDLNGGTVSDFPEPECLRPVP